MGDYVALRYTWLGLFSHKQFPVPAAAKQQYTACHACLRLLPNSANSHG